LTYTAATEISTLSLHDALPICELSWPRLDVLDEFLQRLRRHVGMDEQQVRRARDLTHRGEVPDRVVRHLEQQVICRVVGDHPERSEEHTSELQSLTNLLCRLLL